MKKLSAQKYSILGPGEVWINGQPVKYHLDDVSGNNTKTYFSADLQVSGSWFNISYPSKNGNGVIYELTYRNSHNLTGDHAIGSDEGSFEKLINLFGMRQNTVADLIFLLINAIVIDAIKRVAKQNNINDTSDDIDDYVITDGIIESGPGFDLIGPNYDSKASTCKECGYENPYIDYDSNYVCRQCKQMVDWAKSASKITRLAGLYFKKTVAKEKRKASGFLLICPKTKELFLVKRAQNVDSPGTWCTVGGGVEKGEDFMQAAKRECVEELGSCPEISDIIDDIDSSMVEDLVYKTFVGVVSLETRENWKPKLNPENDEFGWFKPNELPKPLHPGLAYTLKILKEKYAK